VGGTKHSLITSVIHAQDFSEANKKYRELREQLIENAFQKVPIRKEENTPTLLIEFFAYYMGYLNNVGVPKHKQKVRDIDHIRKVDLSFQLYLTALQTNGINTNILKFTDVTDEMVGFIHDHFLSTLAYANKTYNNRMALLRTFTSHVINEFKFDYKNPFLGVPDLIVTPKVTAVRENEFEKLLSILTPENGIEKRVQKGRVNLRTTTWYKPWLKHAFQLGLYTGGRSEDIVELKWCDIQLTEDGKFDTLKTIDYKIDKANSNRTSQTDRLFKHFAITNELAQVIIEMGYEKFKGSNKYIIATEENLKRTNVARIISGAFTHYYKQLNTGRAVTFRNLRKTYITSALNQFGAASTALTNHKNISISDKHYHDKEVTRNEAKKTFSVFANNTI